MAEQLKLISAIEGCLDDAIEEGHRIANDGEEQRGVINGLKGVATRARDIVSGIIEQIKEKISDLFGGNVSTEDAEVDLSDWIADYSEMVAVTEIHTAVEEAIVETWQAQGVTQLYWAADPNACEKCAENADASPQPINSPQWPNPPEGNGPPLHPRCRCTTAKE